MDDQGVYRTATQGSEVRTQEVTRHFLGDLRPDYCNVSPQGYS